MCTLPDELLLLIFSYLSPYQVICLNSTCRRLARLCASNRLWYELLLINYSCHTLIHNWADNAQELYYRLQEVNASIKKVLKNIRTM